MKSSFSEKKTSCQGIPTTTSSSHKVKYRPGFEGRPLHRQPPKRSVSPLQIKMCRDVSRIKMERSAIIPYYLSEDGDVIFFLGVDSVSGDVCDMGGGVKKYETPITGALREFNEESRGIFGDVSVSKLESSLCIFNKTMCTILIKIEKENINLDKFITPVSEHHHVSIYNSTPNQSDPFGKNHRQKRPIVSLDRELSDIILVDKTYLSDISNGKKGTGFFKSVNDMSSGSDTSYTNKKMWSRLRNFYSILNFIELEKILKII